MKQIFKNIYEKHLVLKNNWLHVNLRKILFKENFENISKYGADRTIKLIFFSNLIRTFKIQ